MTHEPRLTVALRSLLNTQRVAALGTLGEDGHAVVSMVPFAIDASTGTPVIHVSGLAAHTRNLERVPRVSLMVMQAEVAGAPVHALARVTLDGMASVLAVDSAAWLSARAAYLTRFPDVEYMTQLGDFRFVAYKGLSTLSTTSQHESHRGDIAKRLTPECFLSFLSLISDQTTLLCDSSSVFGSARLADG